MRNLLALALLCIGIALFMADAPAAAIAIPALACGILSLSRKRG